MIRRGSNGRHYCDGRYCGYPLAWVDCDPEDGADGMWRCLDCGSSMYAAAPAAADAFCDLCSEPMVEDRDAFDATGLNICPQCIEDTLHASAFNARSEVGLVGSGGVRC